MKARKFFKAENFRAFLVSSVGIAIFSASHFFAACAVFTTRPVQEMSDTSAAIRAAKEVQADTLAPELYRQSKEWFFKAQQEYKLKNFKNAKEHAETARKYAEEAELEALKNNGVRNSEAFIPDPLSDAASAPGGNIASPPPPPPPPAQPYDYPSTTPTPFDQYDKRKQEDDSKKAQDNKPEPYDPNHDVSFPQPNYPVKPDDAYRYQNLPQK